MDDNSNQFTNYSRIFTEHCISKLEQDNRYMCELCRFKINTTATNATDAVLAHIYEDKKHPSKYNAFKDDLITLNLPEPTSAQLFAINELVERESKRLLNATQLHLRLSAIQEIESIVNNWFPRTPISLRPYGSIVSGFALNTSDVNVELLLGDDVECNSAQILQNVAMQMSEHPSTFSSIQTEFDISSPRFSFRYCSRSLGSESPVMHFGVHSSSSLEVAQLLAKYASFDPRVTKLAACFKIWAQNCGFDRADRGFWPSHSFYIMTIHFLQSTSPPVLPSLFPPDGSTSSKEEIDKVYQELKNSWTTLNHKSLGQLWLELLAYYTIDFNSDLVVNVRGLNLTLAFKEWTTCILAVEDPVHHNHNLSRSIGRKELYYNYHYNLVRTYNYFMFPITQYNCLSSKTDFIQKLSLPRGRTQLNYDDSDEDPKEKGSDDELEVDGARGVSKASKKELNFTYHVKLAKKFGISFHLSPDARQKWANLHPRDFYYSLKINDCHFFKAPPMYCIKCKKTEHFKSSCPVEELPKLIPVPDILPPDQLSRLDEVCLKLYADERLDPFYEKVHQAVLESLTVFVREIYSNANLQLFGSSKNGFGAKKCDLDLCMTFKDNEDGKDIDQTSVIQKLAKELKRKEISNLQPIPQAKVPVLKLRFKLTKTSQDFPKHFQENFDCDISLYNLLAIHNTRLLKTYCLIDERVAVLGFTVKQFFKICGICDASKGSLSSYAYTLMTLYYLQRCSPPVIPFLQELYDGDSLPKREVDDCNTWFFSDLDRLPEKWPLYGRNTSSVGSLFYGFLKFYSEVFLFDKTVVCIRRSKDLSKMEKEWTGRRIAIEDPFLLSHNLGQGIEMDMAFYIRASIILGRNRIGVQPNSLGNYDSWDRYFFDTTYLTYGPFPKGRGCHFCNKIGHQKINCPEKNRGKNNGDTKSLFKDTQRRGKNADSKKKQRPHNQESSPSNSFNNPFERHRQGERTLYNPYQHQPQHHPHQQFHHRQHTPNHQLARLSINNNANFNTINNQHQSNHYNNLDYPNNNSKRDDASMFHHSQRQHQYNSSPLSGNRPVHPRFNSPRTSRNNYFQGIQGDGFFKSPEFPGLDNLPKRDFNRRR